MPDSTVQRRDEVLAAAERLFATRGGAGDHDATRTVRSHRQIAHGTGGFSGGMFGILQNGDAFGHPIQQILLFR